MSVEQLGRLHQRYVDLSNAFKSTWTFHQFLQGVEKVFGDRPRRSAVDFQRTYSKLRSISSNLTEAGVETAEKQLAEVEEGVAELTAQMLEADSRVTPARLRQFFQRVKAHDDNILAQLVSFYLYSASGEERWQPDRLDKADFLVTMLCEEVDENSGEFTLREPTRIRELGQGFWRILGTQPLPQEQVDELSRDLAALRRAAREAESIESLNQARVVRRHREFKHSLGSGYFQPSLFQGILDTNLALKNTVRELYRQEERRIVAEYQEIFELERDTPMDLELTGELADFRDAVERFEKQLEGANIRIEEMARLREKMRRLRPRLMPEGKTSELDGPFVVPAEVAEALGAEVAPPVPVAAGSEYSWVESHYQRIVRDLQNTNPALDAKKVTMQPELFNYRLEPREVIAYRRIYGHVTCEREIEQLVLYAAALRLRIEEEVEEIRGLLEDSAMTRENELFSNARRTVRMADSLLHRLTHLIEQHVLAEDATEARSTQVLRMRLMRSYSGLWLLVNRSP